MTHDASHLPRTLWSLHYSDMSSAEQVETSHKGCATCTMTAAAFRAEGVIDLFLQLLWSRSGTYSHAPCLHASEAFTDIC